MEVSKLYSSEPTLVGMLVRAGQNGDVETIDMITDRLAGNGLCRPRKDQSGLGALRLEATLHARRRGCISEKKAAEDLKRWGLM